MKDERSVEAERVGPYLVRDGFILTADEMSRAVDASLRKNSPANQCRVGDNF